MTINCVCEHNGNVTLLYAVDYIGAYARGESLEIAISKMPIEINSYLRWLGENIPANIDVVIVDEKKSELQIKDANSDVLFQSEKAPLTRRTEMGGRDLLPLGQQALPSDLSVLHRKHPFR